MQQQEELELIRRIVNGETDLYAILARRYGRVVYTLVSRIVGCAEDAEELAQDVFLKAFRNLHRFNGRSSFPTWLFRIAYNTAVSETRRAQTRMDLHRPGAAGEPARQRRRANGRMGRAGRNTSTHWPVPSENWSPKSGRSLRSSTTRSTP